MKKSEQPMKQIRLRIIELLDQHKGTYESCKGCSRCGEIKQLQQKLNREPAVKFQHILDKGQDMTKSEIAFLLENDVTVGSIRKAVGISNTDFSKMLINYGFRYKRKGTAKMAKVTLEQYQELKTNGLSDKEIAQNLEMNPQYLSQLKKKWDIRPVLSPTVEIESSESKTTQEDKTTEYKAIIKSLTNDLEKAHLKLAKMEESENLHAACEDVENELASLRDENAQLVKQGHHDSYIISNQKYQLEKWAMEVEALEEENKALKYFARKYLG
jgi:hypothetical protein